jgi:release factor glutamine methyltransferase
MTHREFLVLRSAESRVGDTAFLDACIILAHCMGITRERLLIRFPEQIDDGAAEAFSALWARRLTGESVAYIVGKKEFFGRDFLVDKRVLVPRPDTETLVEAALEIGDAVSTQTMRPIRIHDVCTGSGAVAISIAAERPEWLVSASDISPEALDVARINASRLLGRGIPLTVADLLRGLDEPCDIITANPPYVPSSETDQLLSKGWGEPRLALDGGIDGLDFIKRLAHDALSRLVPGGFLLIETDALQSRATSDILIQEGFDGTRIWKDLAGLERITQARRP